MKNYLTTKLVEILKFDGLELNLIKNNILIGNFWLADTNKINSFVYNIPEGLYFHFLFSKTNKIKGIDFKTNKQNYNFILTEVKLLYNLISGIIKPYERIIEIYGTGFKFLLLKNNFGLTYLEISAGHSKKDIIIIPSNIVTNSINSNSIRLISYSKKDLSFLCDRIKHIKPMNKYKLRGIKFSDEIFVPKVYKKTK